MVSAIVEIYSQCMQVQSTDQRTHWGSGGGGVGSGKGLLMQRVTFELVDKDSVRERRSSW